jgi:hypothetical protein
MRRLVYAVCLCVSACGYGAVSVEGDFGKQPFAPTGTVFAVVDSHIESPQPGGGVRVETRADPTVALFFCQAAINPDVDFADMSGSEIAQLRETVRRGDMALVRDMAKASVTKGARLELTSNRADFSLTLSGRTQPIGANDTYAEIRPLGRVVSASFVANESDAREGGHINATLTLVRERDNDQPANTATGKVTLRFDAPVVGERLGESNLRALGY